jgi:hypothetical protein
MVEAKFILNQTFINHKAYEWEGSYAYSSIVRGFLHLQAAIMFLPSLRIRIISLTLPGEKFMDISCPPHTLQIFSECFRFLSW